MAPLVTASVLQSNKSLVSALEVSLYEQCTLNIRFGIGGCGLSIPPGSFYAKAM